MWNPATYLQFQSERDRPFFDLLAQVGDLTPRTVIDLGCGTGHLTAALARRWPHARVTGIDSSAQMLAAASSEPHLLPNLHFVQADLRAWRAPQAPDLLVSNAALQWVPGHEHLIPQLATQVAPGGTFAFQVPANFAAPSHTLLQRLCVSERWHGQLADLEQQRAALSDLAAERYVGLLAPLGFAVNAWETSYLHLLSGPDAVLEWTRGTALRPVLTRLDTEDAAEFERDYAALLRLAYPEQPYGTPFPFRRVFVVARRT
ncbi:methyltransferase domain-containing protein [Deinococcus sp.]|uniref:methyltransferase domain-containing protein n=1 Tax=Deinococcus sp. TaxID=47478 RepID=UPI003CC5BB4F